MNDSKPAISSATIWGGIIACINYSLLLAGVKVEGLDDPQLPLLISGLFGSALAIYGRLRPGIVQISGWLKSRR